MLQNKLYIRKIRLPSFELLVKEIKETPKILWVMVVAFGCLPEREGKNALPKVPHIFHWRIELELSDKPSPWGLILRVYEDSMQAAKGETSVYPAVKPMNHNNQHGKKSLGVH